MKGKTWIVYKYQLRGAPPNKGYIGQTCVGLERRDKDHQYIATAKRIDGRWASSLAWSNALRKYGRQAFDLVVLETHDTFEAAVSAEVRHIAACKTHRRHGGYNSTLGGEGVSDLSEDARRRHKENSTAANQSAEKRARIAAAQRGRTISPEQRAQISARHKGKKRSPEAVAKMAATNRGRKYSPETKAKMSLAAKGRRPSPEILERAQAAWRGRKHTDETKRRIAEASRARVVSKETRAKISAVHKGKFVSLATREKLANRNISVETRAKMSAAYWALSPEEKERRKAAVSTAHRGKS